MLRGTVKRLNSALKDFSLSENEYIIKPVNTHKLLGLHIDNTLSWTTHVNHLCSKLCSRLYLFNKIKNHMPAFVRKQYFDVLVQPFIDYECVIWGSDSHDLLLKVHNTVKMHARSMMDIRDKRLIPTIELFEILDIMPIDIHIKYMHILHGNTPSYLCKLFSVNDTIHNHNTRNSHSLHIPKYKLATGQRTFKYRDTQFWLGLDISVKQAPNLECFKRRLRKHLMLNVLKGHHLNLDVPRYHQHI